MPAVQSTVQPPLRRRAILRAVRAAMGIAALSLARCAAVSVPRGPAIQPPRLADGAFEMPDGVELPYRAWMPDGQPAAVVLALHGMNDSRDAWEIPAPSFNAVDLAVYAPDQRGFGTSEGRGYWPGGDALVDDAREMARLLHDRHPGVPLVLMGESMGGSVLMRLATEADAPPDARYVLVAPAVWGRARMNVFLRVSLYLADRFVPGLTATRAPGVKITASDNREALIRLSRDPLTIRATRVDAIKGLVDLMDAALAAAPYFRAPGLFLYGGKDDLVPAEATVATWRALPSPDGSRGPRIAYYPQGYHLILRDRDRGVAIRDVTGWIANRAAPLASGADAAAAAWLARQKDEA